MLGIIQKQIGKFSFLSSKLSSSRKTHQANSGLGTLRSSLVVVSLPDRMRVSREAPWRSVFPRSNGGERKRHFNEKNHTLTHTHLGFSRTGMQHYEIVVFLLDHRPQHVRYLSQLLSNFEHRLKFDLLFIQKFKESLRIAEIS